MHVLFMRRCTSDAPYNPGTAVATDFTGTDEAYEGTNAYPLAGGVAADTSTKHPLVWFQAGDAGAINLGWIIQYQVK
jgi:hypothetical protein